MFFTVVALCRGRKKIVWLGFRNICGKTVSESSEEESEPRQYAGLCPEVSWSILPLSAKPPPMPCVHWKGNDKERKGLCVQNPHQKNLQPSNGQVNRFLMPEMGGKTVKQCLRLHGGTSEQCWRPPAAKVSGTNLMYLSILSWRVCTQSCSPECEGEGLISALTAAAQFLLEGGFWREPGNTQHVPVVRNGALLHFPFPSEEGNCWGSGHCYHWCLVCLDQSPTLGWVLGHQHKINSVTILRCVCGFHTSPFDTALKTTPEMSWDLMGELIYPPVSLWVLGCSELQKQLRQGQKCYAELDLSQVSKRSRVWSINYCLSWLGNSML